MDYPIIPEDWSCMNCINEPSVHDIDLMGTTRNKKSILINTPGDSLLVINTDNMNANLECAEAINESSRRPLGLDLSSSGHNSSDDGDILAQHVCKIID